MEQWIL